MGSFIPYNVGGEKDDIWPENTRFGALCLHNQYDSVARPSPNHFFGASVLAKKEETHALELSQHPCQEDS